MTPNEFRRLARALPDAAESSHMGHPDFRVRGRIFATMGYPDDGHGMVKLTPGQQADILEIDRSGAFSPAAGAWGRKGSTVLDLRTADRELVRTALGAAWSNLAPKTVAPSSPRKRPSGKPRSRKPARNAAARPTRKES